MEDNDLINSISKLAEVHQSLGKQAFVVYKILVIIQLFNKLLQLKSDIGNETQILALQLK